MELLRQALTEESRVVARRPEARVGPADGERSLSHVGEAIRRLAAMAAAEHVRATAGVAGHEGGVR